MENQELETLNLCKKPPFKIQPYRRRRPLESQTSSTYIRIITECHSHLQNPEHDETIQGDHLVENNDSVYQGDQLIVKDKTNDLRLEDGSIQSDQLVEHNKNSDLRPEGGLTQHNQLAENNNNNNNESWPEGGSIQGDQFVEINTNIDLRPENVVVCEKSFVKENREVGSQDPGFNGDSMEIDGVESVDNVNSNGVQGDVNNINGVKSVVEGNHKSSNDITDCALVIDNDDQFSLPDFDLKEFGLEEELGEKASCADVSELIDSLLETDVIAESSILVGTKDGNTSPMERDETETQVEVMISDTPSASVMVSSSLNKTVEGIENGDNAEVSEVVGKSSDLLHDVSLAKNSTNKGQLSGDTIHKEKNSLKKGQLSKDTIRKEKNSENQGQLSDDTIQKEIKSVKKGQLPGDTTQKEKNSVKKGQLSADTTQKEKNSVKKVQQSRDLLHKDVASLEKNSVKKGQLAGDIIRDALHKGCEKDNQSFGPSKNGLWTTSTAVDVEMGNDNSNLVENRTKLVYYGDILEDDSAERKDSRVGFERSKQRCGLREANSPASCPKNLSLSASLTGENIIENQCSASTEKVSDVNNKKRKQGPGNQVPDVNNKKRKQDPRNQEKKDRKKKKERMKRAEKNRKLGVKRLKLQPESKPKTVIYCRHFLKGRCHEGEKCKYSHDTIPLTKSKPCCHFARQTCMKGDDCPFDHQLSKYPCKNYVSQGSCSRGANCMFSHQVPVKEGSSAASDICKPGLDPAPVKENPNLKKQMNPNDTGNQNVGAKLSPSGISSSKNDKHKIEGTTSKPVGQVPKGMSFLSHGKVPGGNMNKHGQSTLSLKADKGAKVDQQTVTDASNVVESLNKNTQKTSAMPPRGVNFLSFGKAPFESSSTKKPSFSSVSNMELGKSPLSDPGKSEQAASSSKTDGGGKAASQAGQGASSITRNMNETANQTPAMTPQGLGSLSVGNLSDNPYKKKQAGPDNTGQTAVSNNESANIKVPSPNPVLPQMLSSPLPHDRPLNNFIDAHSKSSLTTPQESILSNTPSSVQQALRSTLAFAAKFESKDRAYGASAGSTDSSSQSKQAKASKILDFLYRTNNTSKK